MERPTAKMLRIGDWCVNPASGEISRNGKTTRIEARTMRLLLCLAEHAGEVVSIDELLSQAWPDVTVTPDSVYQAVASLRRLLGDDSKQPSYIATAPRLGYRMVATVGPWTSPRPDHSIELKGPGPRGKAGLTWPAGAAFCLALILLVAFLYRSKVASSNPSQHSVVDQPPEKSIAVLPFLDLTEGMKQEEFADGMTEELIDRLSRIPGLRVTPPTSSFYFKGKQMTVADVARALGVAYVLDGSVRTSGARLRVAARLIRADSGFVVWSQAYDRPLHDILMVQDDIAGEVTKALQASIEGKPGAPQSPIH
jgi:TolB-like protein/DNA-binding winged helix-turn-helix (wHTH) protein